MTGVSPIRQFDVIFHGGTPHGYVNGPCSLDVICETIPIARLGDSVLCDIHGTQSIAGPGSSTTLANSLIVSIHGDLTTCGANIVGSAVLTLII